MENFGQNLVAHYLHCQVRCFDYCHTGEQGYKWHDHVCHSEKKKFSRYGDEQGIGLGSYDNDLNYHTAFFDQILNSYIIPFPPLE